jgi:hypothetical protein
VSFDVLDQKISDKLNILTFYQNPCLRSQTVDVSRQSFFILFKKNYPHLKSLLVGCPSCNLTVTKKKKKKRKTLVANGTENPGCYVKLQVL